MLLLPHSIIVNELETLSEFFSVGSIIKSAKKIKDGLGIRIAGAPKGSCLYKNLSYRQRRPWPCRLPIAARFKKNYSDNRPAEKRRYWKKYFIQKPRLYKSSQQEFRINFSGFENRPLRFGSA